MEGLGISTFFQTSRSFEAVYPNHITQVMYHNLSVIICNRTQVHLAVRQDYVGQHKICMWFT